MSLAILLIAAICNSVALRFLPQLIASPFRHASFHFAAGARLPLLHIWLWLGGKFSVYGWAVFALALLSWDYFRWPDSRPILRERIKRWAVRCLLVFAVVISLVPAFPRWMPAVMASTVLPKIPRLPVSIPWDLPGFASWFLVAMAAALLAANAETRDSLLGQGRVLGILSVASLIAVLILGFSALVP